MKQLIVADIEVCQEFRLGATWYKALLPALCRIAGLTGNRWCINLTSMKEEPLKASRKVEQVR